MTRVIRVLTVALAMLAAAEAAAQDTPEETPLKVEEPVVVTATKTPTPVGQTGASVTVIDGAAIQQRQAIDIIQILRDQPGFTLIQTGPRGGAASISTRGGNTDMNLVLVDGMKVNLGGGGFDFGGITSAGIGRVEIVRGPQSALHGADAMTSVIQFFTPRGDGPLSAWGFGGGGNHDSHEERVGVSWGNRLAGVFAEFLNVETSGILDVNNDYRNRTGAIRLDLSPTPDLDLTVTGRYVDSRLEVPTEGAGDRFEVLDPRQFQEDERFVGTFKTAWRQTPWLEHRLLLGASLTATDFVDPLDPVPTDFSAFRSEDTERRLLADYSALVSLPPIWQVVPSLVLGAGYEHQNFRQEATFSAPVDVDRETVSTYAQLQLDWRDHVFLTAGGRYDDSTAFGTEITPRVSLAVVAPVTRTRLRGAWGTGIKEPSFFAQFGGFGLPGNPGIEAEKSESWEVGLDQPLFGRLLQVGVTYFETRFDDLIVFDLAFPEGSRNIQAAKTRGVEFAAAFGPFHGWTASGTYTYLDTEVTDDGDVADQTVFPEGQPLLRRPRHSGSVSVGYTRDRFTAVASLFVKGESIDRDFSRPFPAPPRRVALPGYEKLDLSFAYTVFRNVLGLREVTWKTRLQNVLNQKYEEVFGFSAPRISALTGLEVRY
jgi:vitamin B12 transporter